MIYIGIGSNLNGKNNETPLQNCKKALVELKKEVNRKIKKSNFFLIAVDLLKFRGYKITKHYFFWRKKNVILSLQTPINTGFY